MGQRLVCRKCRNGLYNYCDPEPDPSTDWGNRKMRCEKCGFEETLHDFCNRKLEKSKICELCKSEILYANNENEIKLNVNTITACESCFQRICDITERLNTIGFNDKTYHIMMESIKK